jgi:hypothetical protein
MIFLSAFALFSLSCLSCQPMDMANMGASSCNPSLSVEQATCTNSAVVHVKITTDKNVTAYGISYGYELIEVLKVSKHGDEAKSIANGRLDAPLGRATGKPELEFEKNKEYIIYGEPMSGDFGPMYIVSQFCWFPTGGPKVFTEEEKRAVQSALKTCP